MSPSPRARQRRWPLVAKRVAISDASNLEVLDNLLELGLGLVHALDVGEARVALGAHLGLGAGAQHALGEVPVLHEGADAREEDKGGAEGAERPPQLRLEGGLEHLHVHGLGGGAEALLSGEGDAGEGGGAGPAQAWGGVKGGQEGAG